MNLSKVFVENGSAIVVHG